MMRVSTLIHLQCFVTGHVPFIRQTYSSAEQQLEKKIKGTPANPSLSTEMTVKLACMCAKMGPVHTSNNVEATFDTVEKNRSTCSVRQCCFDIVASMDGALQDLCEHLP